MQVKKTVICGKMMGKSLLCAHTVCNFALEKSTGITFLRVTIMIILNFVVLQLAMVLKNTTLTLIKG
jgi:hypothetical protein